MTTYRKVRGTNRNTGRSVLAVPRSRAKATIKRKTRIPAKGSRKVA